MLDASVVEMDKTGDTSVYYLKDLPAQHDSYREFHLLQKQMPDTYWTIKLKKYQVISIFNPVIFIFVGLLPVLIIHLLVKKYTLVFYLT